MTNDPNAAIAIFLIVLVVGVILIRLFTSKDVQRGEQVKERARAAVAARPGTTFHNGAMAAIDGDQRWENPHCDPSEGPDQFSAWDAGWCCGRQMLRKMGGQP